MTRALCSGKELIKFGYRIFHMENGRQVVIDRFIIICSTAHCSLEYWYWLVTVSRFFVVLYGIVRCVQMGMQLCFSIFSNETDIERHSVSTR